MWLSEEFLSFSCIDNTLCCAGRGRSDDSHAGKRFIVLHVELTLNTDSRGFVTSSHGARRDSFDQKLNVLHLNCVKTRPTSKLKWLTPNFAVIAHHREARSLFFFLSWRRTTTLCTYSFAMNASLKEQFSIIKVPPWTKIMGTVQRESPTKAEVKKAQKVTSLVLPQ